MVDETESRNVFKDNPTEEVGNPHDWPANGQHLYGEWHQQDRTTIYRICVHPKCKHVDRKKVKG